MDPTDLVMTVARVWVGVVMLAHGLNHARSLDGTASWFAKKGFRFAPVQARVSAYGELAIGASLVAGLLTAVGAMGVVAVTTVAFWSIHRFAGFFVFRRPDEGYEFVVTLALAAIAVSTHGAGPWSVDALLGLEDRLNGWTGLLVALSGIGLAAVQLVSFWRRPSD
ncbi:MAG TPA: DoxX family protein [Acidimicrobiia bacterium]|nr:DoxX family protein [Acidimicrobiia bacterium]